jgi:hypothetical protein
VAFVMLFCTLCVGNYKMFKHVAAKRASARETRLAMSEPRQTQWTATNEVTPCYGRCAPAPTQPGPPWPGHEEASKTMTPGPPQWPGSPSQPNSNH